jgi:hypothetical protein
MKNRFRLIYRGERGATFYCVDSVTGKRTSLQTKDRDAAKQILFPKNQAVTQPSINLQLVKAYLAGSDSGVGTRTWQNALDALVETKHGSTKERWIRAAKEKPLDLIRHKVIIESQAEHLLECIKVRTVSTNVHLRKLRRNFYELCWHLVGSQSDVAHLNEEDIGELATCLGDTSEAAFNRTFKRVIGITPGAARVSRGGPSARQGPRRKVRGGHAPRSSVAASVYSRDHEVPLQALITENAVLRTRSIGLPALERLVRFAPRKRFMPPRTKVEVVDGKMKGKVFVFDEHDALVLPRLTLLHLFRSGSLWR